LKHQLKRSAYSNANRNVGAVVLPIGHFGVRPNLKLPLDGRILVDLEVIVFGPPAVVEICCPVDVTLMEKEDLSTEAIFPDTV
jgi:hypothetical protein